MLGGNCSSYAASDTTRIISKGPSFLFLIFREGRCLSQSPCKWSDETRTLSPNLNCNVLTYDIIRNPTDADGCRRMPTDADGCRRMPTDADGLPTDCRRIADGLPTDC